MSLSDTFDCFGVFLGDNQPSELLNYETDTQYDEQGELIQEIRIYGLEEPIELDQEIQSLIKDFNEDPENEDLLKLQAQVQILPADEDLRGYLEHFFCQKFPQLQKVKLILKAK